MFDQIANKLYRQNIKSKNKKVIQKVKNYTLSDKDRLNNLANICQFLNEKNIVGDFVECGVCNGGSAALISSFLRNETRLWLYDSFEGMPITSDQDGEEAKKWVGSCNSSPEIVKQALESVGTLENQYLLLEGYFNESFLKKLPNQVALLHCDADWYESVFLVLETFYPLVSDGGCIVLDDFGYWEGCREAFYDFCQKYNEKPLLERMSSTQAYWFKGKSHNRI